MFYPSGLFEAAHNFATSNPVAASVTFAIMFVLVIAVAAHA